MTMTKSLDRLARLISAAPGVLAERDRLREALDAIRKTIGQPRCSDRVRVARIDEIVCAVMTKHTRG